MGSKRDDLFKLIDRDRNGSLGLEELSAYINTFGPALKQSEVELMMSMIGMEGKNSLSRMDFDTFMDKDVFLTIPKGEVLPHFEVFDPSKTGRLPMEVLVTKFGMFGERFKSADAVRDVFKGPHFREGYLYYNDWIDDIFG